jgi:hypothetical protein
LHFPPAAFPFGNRNNLLLNRTELFLHFRFLRHSSRPMVDWFEASRISMALYFQSNTDVLPAVRAGAYQPRADDAARTHDWRSARSGAGGASRGSGSFGGRADVRDPNAHRTGGRVTGAGTHGYHSLRFVRRTRSAAGIDRAYGVMAYSVARRTSEIGQRMALGAQASHVAWVVLRETMLLAGLGLAIGLPLSISVVRLISSRLLIDEFVHHVRSRRAGESADRNGRAHASRNRSKNHRCAGAYGRNGRNRRDLHARISRHVRLR